MVADGVQLVFLHWNVPARQCPTPAARLSDSRETENRENSGKIQLRLFKVLAFEAAAVLGKLQK